MNELMIWFMDMINVLAKNITNIYPLIIAIMIIADIFIIKFTSEQGEKKRNSKTIIYKKYTFDFCLFLSNAFLIIKRHTLVTLDNSVL